MLIPTRAILDMKKKYFPKPSDFVDSLIEKTIQLAANTTENEILSSFDSILQVLKERD